MHNLQPHMNKLMALGFCDTLSASICEKSKSSRHSEDGRTSGDKRKDLKERPMKGLTNLYQVLKWGEKVRFSMDRRKSSESSQRITPYASCVYYVSEKILAAHVKS